MSTTTEKTAHRGHHILFSFDDSMYSVFVYSHDGNLPILRDSKGENPVVAFPLTKLEFSELNIDRLCEFIRAQYAAHARQDEVTA